MKIKRIPQRNFVDFNLKKQPIPISMLGVVGRIARICSLNMKGGLKNGGPIEGGKKPRTVSAQKK